jgi:5-oxopent-3-ene-1,2,5-tricarboxylate decarboxylase / 2-hydroxyhepta-2,4-diene-1,7-dioate isomerase
MAGETLAWQPEGIGTVYGVILNDRDTLERMGAALHAAPYAKPPVAPVLYIKPANTFARSGDEIALPSGADVVEVCGTIGIVMAHAARRVSERDAMRLVRGFVVVADLTLPHESVYRPAIREKCFDGSCVIGSDIVPAGAIPGLGTLTVKTSVNGMVMQRWSLSRLVRPVAKLIADVSAFMTLFPGDILLAGIAADAPRAREGDLALVEIDGVGRVECRIGGAIP